MKNAYAAKIQERKRLERHVTRQLMADCALIAANIVFGAGEKRCAAFMRKMEEVYTEMAEIQQKDTEDMEYTKAVVDRKLQAILGDQFKPWERRYCYYDG